MTWQCACALVASAHRTLMAVLQAWARRHSLCRLKRQAMSCTPAPLGQVAGIVAAGWTDGPWAADQSPWLQALWQLQRGPLLGVEARPPSERASLQAAFVSASSAASLAMLSPRLLVLDLATGTFQPSASCVEALHAGRSLAPAYTCICTSVRTYGIHTGPSEA